MSEEKEREPKDPDTQQLEVLHSRSLADLPSVQAHLVGANGQVADLFLRFVQETARAGTDDIRLKQVIADYTFQAFPQATHLILGLQGEEREIKPLIARSREGEQTGIALSKTLVSRVMNEGVALLFSQAGETNNTSESIVVSRIKTAICAPLLSQEKPFGLIQLDIRHPGTGRFGGKDVDRLTVFAHYVALVLDNLRLYQDQRRAFASTISALVHSLSLKDPDTAHHSERVQAISMILGRTMGLSGASLEALNAASILHDMGKQGIRDDVLLKPGKLSNEERGEMSLHAEHTQDILDKILYPPHLKDVPQMAAYHHEKVNGKGPYRIPGDRIPVQSMIISVSDVFDALYSARVYKSPMSLTDVLGILDRGRDKDWAENVVDATHQSLEKILRRVYGRSEEETELELLDMRKRRAA